MMSISSQSPWEARQGGISTKSNRSYVWATASKAILHPCQTLPSLPLLYVRLIRLRDSREPFSVLNLS